MKCVRYVAIVKTWILLFIQCGRFSILAATEANIQLGSQFTPAQNNRWVSPNDTFALGFYAQANDTYSVGVLFQSITQVTVAWSAGGSDKRVGKNSAFQLTSQGDLVLRDLNSSLISWSSNTSNLGVVGAAMLDNGNFVLLNSSSGRVWESFLNPTDTLLPGQQINADSGQMLTATMNNHTYTAVMEANGNLSLMWDNVIIYWGSGTASGPESELPTYAALDTTGWTFGLYNTTNQTNPVKSWKSNDYTDTTVTLRRLKLDTDGNIRIYGWSSDTMSWNIGWQGVQDQCDVYGWCGAYGLCTYNTTSNDPICSCPTSAGFVSIDDRNLAAGCRREVSLQACDDKMMSQLDHTMLFSYPPEDNDTYNAGESDCSRECIKNSYCYASTSLNDGSGRCLLKFTDWISGYHSPQLGAESFVKVCSNDLLSPSPAFKTSSPSSTSSVSSKVFAIAIVGAILATLATVILLEGSVWYFCRQKMTIFSRYSAQYALLEYASGAPIQFSYRELHSATQNFKDKLGEGGFGTVYKGLLPNKMVVAVKRLEGVDQGEKQFRVEVGVIGSTHHMNLVRLCGFCVESKHRMLVYEYMANGSLDQFLFLEGSPHLGWETRFNILLGTARGILYLHQECRDCIIHCDIKPENILLDENFCAKVSDFGLAKLMTGKQKARSMTTVRGTRGYLAPEWRSNLPITIKSDVFSFGMVVLEAIGGRRNFDTIDNMKFSEWAYREYFQNQCFQNIVDERIRNEVNMEQLDRAVRVAFWCVQVQPSLRPSMNKVVQILEGALAMEPPPLPRFFGESTAEEEKSILDSELQVQETMQYNELIEYSTVSGR
eukprot:c22654_g1_i1 orf=1131-3614(-)